jgi:hypothetical protein
MKKRMLILLLMVCLVVALFPVTSNAATGDSYIKVSTPQAGSTYLFVAYDINTELRPGGYPKDPKDTVLDLPWGTNGSQQFNWYNSKNLLTSTADLNELEFELEAANQSHNGNTGYYLKSKASGYVDVRQTLSGYSNPMDTTITGDNGNQYKITDKLYVTYPHTCISSAQSRVWYWNGWHQAFYTLYTSDIYSIGTKISMDYCIMHTNNGIGIVSWDLYNDVYTNAPLYLMGINPGYDSRYVTIPDHVYKNCQYYFANDTSLLALSTSADYTEMYQSSSFPTFERRKAHLYEKVEAYRSSNIDFYLDNNKWSGCSYQVKLEDTRGFEYQSPVNNGTASFSNVISGIYSIIVDGEDTGLTVDLSVDNANKTLDYYNIELQDMERVGHVYPLTSPYRIRYDVDKYKFSGQTLQFLKNTQLQVLPGVYSTGGKNYEYVYDWGGLLIGTASSVKEPTLIVDKAGLISLKVTGYLNVTHSATPKSVEYQKGNIYPLENIFDIDSNAGSRKYTIEGANSSQAYLCTDNGIMNENGQYIRIFERGSYSIKLNTARNHTTFYSEGSAISSISALDSQDPPPAPESASITASSITLQEIQGAEYKMDDGAWQASTTFTGLDPFKDYTFYARFLETETQLLSDSSPGTVITTLKADQVAPSAPVLDSISASSITLKEIQGAEYKMKDGEWQDSTSFTDLDPAATYTFYARLKETDTQFPSPASPATDITTLKAEQTAPDAPILDSKTASSITLQEIQGAEYKMNEGAWQASTNFTGLDPITAYTFYARLKETDTQFPSPASQGTVITTLQAEQDAPDAPILDSKSASSITLQEIQGAEYKMNDGEWQDSATFVGLDPITDYTFYARFLETTTHLLSESSPGTVITTLKADQDAPDAPVSDNISATSVTLKEIQGAEYKMDEGEWQDGASFTGLDPAATYTFYARLKETDTQFPSPASQGTVITTLQAEQDAPHAPILHSKSAHAITLQEIQGAEYKMNDGEWQDSATFTGLDPITEYTFYARFAETTTKFASPVSIGTAITTLDKLPQTLINTLTGISIDGNIHVHAMMRVEEGVLDQQGRCAACDAIRRWMKDDAYVLLYYKDISLTEDYEGVLTLTIPVDAKYNGKTMTILHCAKGTLKRYTSIVKDGTVSFVVTELSPFAVFAKKEDVKEVPTTGESNIAQVSGFLFLSVGFALFLIAKRRKHYQGA